jgi:hypothetical protein
MASRSRWVITLCVHPGFSLTWKVDVCPFLSLRVIKCWMGVSSSNYISMVLEGGCYYLTDVVDCYSFARVIVGGVACFEDET